MSEQDLDTDIWLFGGGVTAGLFLKHNLIDLVELAVVPVALGEGRPLFADASDAAHLRARLIPAHRHGLHRQQLPPDGTRLLGGVQHRRS